MAQKKSRVVTDKTKPVGNPAGKKSSEAIGRRKLFKLGVGLGVAALPYVIPTIYTFTVPKMPLPAIWASHME